MELLNLAEEAASIFIEKSIMAFGVTIIIGAIFFLFFRKGIGSLQEFVMYHQKIFLAYILAELIKMSLNWDNFFLLLILFIVSDFIVEIYHHKDRVPIQKIKK